MKKSMTVFKPQDLAVLLKVIATAISVQALVSGLRAWTFESLSRDMLLSASEMHAALKRAEQARLFDSATRIVKVAALEDFMLHGMQYVYLPTIGLETRGIPTSIAAPPLVYDHFDPIDLPPVWEHPMGVTRGYAFEPLYKNAPAAAMADTEFYELLTLADALREGSMRVKSVAATQLKIRLEDYRQISGKA